MVTVGDLQDGFVIVLQQDCDTCVEIAPALRQLGESGLPVTFASQDDVAFVDGLEMLDDSDLALSWELDVEATPTVVKIRDGKPESRIVGWSRREWEAFLGIGELAPELAAHRPGCGSRTLLPGMPEQLAARYDGARLSSRRIELGELEDEFEALFARGWTDGLPVVPPTPQRVLRMLEGTHRDPGETVAVLAPNYQPATVEKIAANAVMAGCRPEYMPVVLAAVEAAASHDFNLHGVAATTFFSGPVVIVNGPITARIGMNSGLNALGPGNRANATIGRALNLIIRNIGGARPGEVDRSMQGHPTKYTMAFAEREHDSPWTSLAFERGIPEGVSAVTLFAGQGPAPVADQLSREPESLARSLATSLRVVSHAKAVGRVAAVVTVAPEHAAVFGSHGWSKQDLRERVLDLLTIPGSELQLGAGGMAPGLADVEPEALIPKFKPENVWFVQVGSTAGLFSGIISGWNAGPKGSRIVTVPIEEEIQ